MMRLIPVSPQDACRPSVERIVAGVRRPGGRGEMWIKATIAEATDPDGAA
jgi:hypothetical protein